MFLTQTNNTFHTKERENVWVRTSMLWVRSSMFWVSTGPACWAWAPGPGPDPGPGRRLRRRSKPSCNNWGENLF